MKVAIHSIVGTSFGGLAPAPSVRECDYIQECLNTDTTPLFTSPAEFIGKPLEVLTTYRGNLIYLEGGLSFHRTNPSTFGGNGMSSMPIENVTEQGSMKWEGVNYNIEVEFIV